jgi:hypothetical protein
LREYLDQLVHALVQSIAFLGELLFDDHGCREDAFGEAP